MKNKTAVIIKKEFRRFFTDSRMVMSVLLPGILMFVMYSVMGQMFTLRSQDVHDSAYRIYAFNLPTSIERLLDEHPNIALDYTDGADSALSAVQAKDAELAIIFPEDFDQGIALFISGDAHTAQNIEIYYNSGNAKSGAAFSSVTAILDDYETSLANVFDINSGGDSYDLASEKDLMGQLFSMIPLLLIILMFSGCMTVSPDAIAGEKERGTFATLLVAPIKRSDIAIGKIVSLCTFSLLSGVSSFIGIVLSLPRLAGNMTLDGISASAYPAADFILMLLVILSTVLVMISLLSVVSTIATGVREANSMTMPLFIVFTLVGATGILSNSIPTATYFYLSRSTTASNA